MTTDLPTRTRDVHPALATILPSRPVSLVEVLDRVIDKGVVVNGEVLLRVAEVDLVFVGLRLLVTSVARAEALHGGRMTPRPRTTAADRADLARLQEELARVEKQLPTVLAADEPATVERGIGKLVLTLVELLRQLLEREAVRRIDQGTLTRTETDKLALTFRLLARKVEELKATFGIREPLNLDLGPLGRLL